MPMLYQLHWQNLSIDKHNETEFVAQAGSEDFPNADALVAHFREIIERRKAECPEGWGPMICDETYGGFAWAPGSKPGPRPTVQRDSART
jgi:hypothetical protein